ncbi:MAG: hypothetical protein RJA70_724 [Pseudomonadota bacterium]|jgi:hypothetical protein
MSSRTFTTHSIQSFLLAPLALGIFSAACGAPDDDNGSREDEVGQSSESPKNDEPKTSSPKNEEPAGQGDGATGSDGSPEPEPGVGELPVDPNADPFAIHLNIDELLKQENCTTGWLPERTETTRTCAAVYSQVCFESDAEACACAGCADDSCQVAESFPTQVSCEGGPAGCNFMWFDICFESAEEACDAAGCSLDKCKILESFPAQVSCDE